LKALQLDIQSEWEARQAIEKSIQIAISCDTASGGSIYLASQKGYK